jgi:hypothetical protein
MHNGVTDLGPDDDDTGERHACEMCTKDGIRYVHHLTHPEGHSADVGCECAMKLCVDYEAGPRADLGGHPKPATDGHLKTGHQM